ncbi:MAG: GNAT family N-acetyltransferase [Candidatus Thermoplasmatota archaeon]|nr:GNAT family N-acetyltransferase [Candidatus Thermoplasmatota archaeon]
MNVRYAQEKDMESICMNNIQMALETESVTLSQEVVSAAVKELINDETKGFYLLVEDEGKVIGQLMITFEWSDWRNATMWWIQSVYIVPAFRKKGVFTLLYEEVKRRAMVHNVSILRLYVHSENTSAIQVYHMKGMTKTSYLVFEEKLEQQNKV